MIFTNMVSLFVGTILMISPLANDAKKDIPNLQLNVDKQSEILNDNKQVYLHPDGTNHTIHWVKGVNAPLVSYDETKNNGSDPNYFRLTKEGKDANFETAYDINRGYYDFNKDIEARPWEAPHCYLVAAVNNITWWLKQNSDLVDEYLLHLKNNDGVFGQEPYLVNVTKYNQDMWDKMRSIPPMTTNQAGFEALEHHYSYLAKEILKVYYTRNDGLAMDIVLDNFFNGYQSLSNYPEDQLPPENSEDMYKMDRNGGYFFPIFGKERLSERYDKTKYSFISPLIFDAIKTNHALTMSYYGPSKTYTHAVTIWGAEADSDGNLVRVFISDSDDYSNAFIGTNTVVGMKSWEVHTDQSDSIQFNSRFDRNDVKGSYLQCLVTLDLGREVFKERLNDNKKPSEPFIEPLPSEIVTSIGANKTIEVKAKLNDYGFLTYQWYVANDLTSKGTAAYQGDKASVKIDTSALGKKYYYCQITHHMKGHRHVSESRRILVEINNDPLVDASIPTIDFVQYANPIYLEKNEQNVKLSVKVTNKDEGTLTYQWYRGYNSMTDGGDAIKGATSKEFIIPTNDANRFFYFCEVTNTNLNVNGIQVRKVRNKFAKTVYVNNYSEQYASAFMQENVCGTDDNTKADAIKFKKMQDLYNQTFASSKAEIKHAKEYLRNVKGNPLSDDIVEQMIAKYDRIISLHGDDEINYPDFMNRRNSPNFTYNAKLDVNNDNIIIDNSSIIVLTASLLALSSLAIASLLIIKKRRKQR